MMTSFAQVFSGSVDTWRRCHGLPRKWTDSAVMTTLSAYISHGQGLGVLL
jgi:hypothetical protein